MLLYGRKIAFGVLGLLGLGAVVASYFSGEIVAYFASESSEGAMLAEGDACAVYEQGYAQSMQNQEEEVFIAGCGGLF